MPFGITRLLLAKLKLSVGGRPIIKTKATIYFNRYQVGAITILKDSPLIDGFTYGGAKKKIAKGEKSLISYYYHLPNLLITSHIFFRSSTQKYELRLVLGTKRKSLLQRLSTFFINLQSQIAFQSKSYKSEITYSLFNDCIVFYEEAL